MTKPEESKSYCVWGIKPDGNDRQLLSVCQNREEAMQTAKTMRNLKYRELVVVADAS